MQVARPLCPCCLLLRHPVGVSCLSGSRRRTTAREHVPTFDDFQRELGELTDDDNAPTREVFDVRSL
jgi:hypothetical protein